MIRRTIAGLALAAVAVGGGLAGCVTNKTPTSTGASSPSAAYPVTVGSLTLTAQPHRIVSLTPTATEMLYAIGAGTQVVAVDDQSNYPPDAAKSNLSGFKPNAEAIAARTPDLVVVQDDPVKVVEALTALKIPVYVTSAAKTMDDAYAQIDALGRLTGHVAEATALAQRMKTDIAKIISDVPTRARPLTYFFEVSPDYYTATSKTFIGALLSQLGLVNIADGHDSTGSGYPQLHAETILTANPDMILLDDTKCCGQSPAKVKARAGWDNLIAVRRNQVVPLDDDIASRWGPRVVDLLRTVADAIARVPTG
jgi:iron complex transport system substrate-binding protein